MSNAYIIPVATHSEFEVRDYIRDSITPSAWLPLRRASKVLKNRKREIRHYDTALLPGYVFAIIPAIYVRDVKEQKHVYEMWPVAHREWWGIPATENHSRIPGVVDFLEAAQREYNAQLASEKTGEALSQFKPGQVLEILEGAFRDIPATFKKAIRSAHDDQTHIVAEMDIMGGKVSVTLDPVSVKPAT